MTIENICGNRGWGKQCKSILDNCFCFFMTLERDSKRIDTLVFVLVFLLQDKEQHDCPSLLKMISGK